MRFLLENLLIKMRSVGEIRVETEYIFHFMTFHDDWHENLKFMLYDYSYMARKHSKSYTVCGRAEILFEVIVKYEISK